MSIAFLGDSITLGYALPHQEDRFATLVAKQLSQQEINAGITGTLMARASMNRADGKDFVSRLKLIHDADIAVIFGGTNDYFWSDRPIDPPNQNTVPSNEFFSCAVKTICEYCRNERKGRTTLFVTPYPHHGIGNYLGGSNWNMSSEHDTSEINFNGHVLLDYVNVIDRLATQAGFPVLNLHQISGFDWHLHTLDGCHPNPLGHRWLADHIIRALSCLSSVCRQ